LLASKWIYCNARLWQGVLLHSMPPYVQYIYIGLVNQVVNVTTQQVLQKYHLEDVTGIVQNILKISV